MLNIKFSYRNVLYYINVLIWNSLLLVIFVKSQEILLNEIHDKYFTFKENFFFTIPALE